MEYTFFPREQGTFTKIDSTGGHKMSLKNIKKIQVTLNIFSDHYETKLKINNKMISIKSPSICKINILFLNSS